MSKRLQLLLNLLESQPTDSFALFATAKEYEGSGEWALALDFYQKLRTADPGYVGLYYHLGKLYERLGDPDAALETYRQGAEAARRAGDHHSLAELNGARLNLGHPDDDEF